MNAKMTLRGRISTLVLRACKLKESQWDAGYGTRTLEVAEIITRLRNALAAYGQQDDDFFVRFYLRQWNDLQRVMPGPQSRCQTMRREMVEMYGYCLERWKRGEAEKGRSGEGEKGACESEREQGHKRTLAPAGVTV